VDVISTTFAGGGWGRRGASGCAVVAGVVAGGTDSVAAPV